ncbi:autotransporter assembly complex family protein [uncultured Roseobacter sp.]|uniref:autotransporter assembly complex protein TamA n=1 Tax=uncultured Roseobacter sp. TaxID=114847 RepID=UPI002610C6D2|nr:autotransporter assembly complex family protein [uncultured Roseobacter sp.]
MALPAAAFDVQIRGELDEALRVQLEGGSLLVEQAASEEAVSPQEIVSTAQADYQRLLAVLYDAGYFGAVIEIKLDGREATSIPPVNPPSSVRQAVVTIRPGRVFRFGRASIAPLAPGTDLPEGFATGQTAGLGLLKNTASAGIDGWRDAGHARAELASQSLTARHAQQEINADLVLAPGPRFRFGPLSVEGESTVRTKRILEIAGLPEGEVFSPDELRASGDRLRRTGAFSSVAMVEADGPVVGDALPVTVKVADAKPRRFGFGAELATLEGLTLSAFWMHRNLLGGAERLRFEGEIKGIGGETGGTDYRLETRFDRPATFNEDTGFYALTEIEQLDQVSFFSRQVTVEAGIERIASDQRSYRLGLGLRRAQTRDDFGEADYTLLLVPAGATFDYRDRPLDARRGYYADVEVSPFVALSGADNGVLTTADLRGYRTFGETNPTTLALRLQFGSVAGPALNVAPADFLFYSGGGGTVRGHDFQSLGVDLGGGREVGGRSFLGLSAEMRFRTSGSLGYVGFIDAGYIGEESFPDGSGEWQSGAGVGLRYDTGIGPIRVDLATATSGNDDASSFQIYIGIGQSF